MKMNSRLNIQFNERQNQALQDLANELGTTKGHVLRTALALLEVALREKKAGNDIGVVKGDRVVKEIVGLE